MAYSSVDSSTGNEFICTECGEGFGQYPKLISHMASHGSIGLFPTNDDRANDNCDEHIEFALHENGTLTVIDKSALSNFSFLFGKPLSNPLLDSTSQDTLPSGKTAENDPARCKCERCGQVFRNQKSLQVHQRYRPLEQGFKCTLCCKIFHDRESLHGHLQNHAHERFYSCGHCGKRFLKQETLQQHQKERHGPLGFKSTCTFDEEQENSLDKSYPCNICGLRFFWLSDLQSHLINHSHVKSSVTITRTEGMQEQDGNGFKKNESNSSDDSVDRSYRCGLCGGHFDSLSDLKHHHLTEHPDEGSSESITRSRRQPLNYYGIMRQMVSKHQLQRLDPFRTRKKGRQRGGISGNPNTKVYPCKQCQRVFVHSSSLSRHMRYHKGTLHTCLYCGRHFPQRCDVTRHVALYHSSEGKVKEGIENLECESEDEIVDNGSSIIQTHTGGQILQSPKPQEELPLLPKSRMTYKCKECNKVFRVFSIYQSHVRYHKRDPSRVLLSCPYCPCRFTFRSALDRHLENHDEQEAENGQASN